MMRALVWKGASGRWWVEVAHEHEISGNLTTPIAIRTLSPIEVDYGFTHAEAMLLAHQLLLSHDRS